MDLITILPILQELFGSYHSIDILKLLDKKDKYEESFNFPKYVDYLIHQLMY